MLYGKHLGLRGSVAKLAAAGDEKYRKLEAIVDELKARGARRGDDARARSGASSRRAPRASG